jgi:hypothetical protein
MGFLGFDIFYLAPSCESEARRSPILGKSHLLGNLTSWRSGGSTISLGMIIKGPEGLVLAAESRITLSATNRETGQKISVSYDNAQKVFNFSKPHTHVGAVTYGAGGIGERSAFSYITEFESSLNETTRLTIGAFALRLSDFYLGQWKSTMPSDYKGQAMTFVVGGYDEGEAYGRVYEFEIPNAPKPVERTSLQEFGITWGGQHEIVDRLLAGYDLRAVDVVKQALNLTDDQVKKLVEALGRFQMPLPINLLPLQDCVDIAILFIRTTIGAQRLTVGIRGVGGPIDIATITRTHGFQWVQRKTLRGETTTFS